MVSDKRSLFLCVSAAFLIFHSACLPAEDISAPLIEYYGEIGCSHCDTFLDITVPEAEKEAGITVQVETHDILSAEGYELCEQRLNELGYDFTIFPVMIAGENVYQGNSAIEENILPELLHYKEFGRFIERDDGTARSADSRKRLAFLPIILAGLIDGINPCAFTTLLFFISFIGAQKGSRKKIVAAGLIFASGIFISYLLIGFGVFTLFRISFDLSLMRTILKLLITGVTAVFLFLSIRDFVLIRKGKPADMTLQLPRSLKRRIHASIRTGSVSPAFMAGIFVTGLIVAVLELACTGQVYFPTISVMVQTDTNLLGIGSLLLYNTAFILPILAVLLLIVFGLRHDQISAFFKKNLGFTKLALALVFASLTVLIWIF